jgi:hypothetical protein
VISPSIAELFKIDDRYFKHNLELAEKEFTALTVNDVPHIKDMDTYIGIEIEMEGVYKSFTSGLWQYLWSPRSDGSLRNGGIEVVSIPIKGVWIRRALKLIYATIKGVVFSNRTSIHIHLDVRALTQKQLTALILVYLAVESLLYKFVGKDRDQNIYCVPLYTTTLVKSLVDWVNKSLDKVNMGHHRYAGLNLDSLRKFGTLEFRHLHGTNDTTKVVNWINLIFKIKQYAMRNDLTYIIDTITALNTNSNYIAFINDVFEDTVYLLDTLELKSDLEKGVKAVKQSIISNKFLMELKKTLPSDSPAFVMYQKLSKNRKEPYQFEEIRVDDFPYDEEPE